MVALARNLLALRKRTDRVQAAFLQTELEIGHTLCMLAKRSGERELAVRNLRAAYAALDALTQFMWKANLEPHELDQLTARIERLRFELENAGGRSDGMPLNGSPSDWQS
jgi:hypothetical protein